MENRHIELSTKFIEMGRALMKEGEEKKDFMISQAGSTFFSLGGLILDEKNMFLFSQVCGLFSAKMILELQQKQKDNDSSE